MSDRKSIYIHIPFCRKKCLYCDFYSIEDTSLKSDYTEAVAREIQLSLVQDSKTVPDIESIYFGGGTPSVLPLYLIEHIMEALHDNYRIDPCCEITMEVNPGTVDMNFFSGIKALGINRVSIGVQSFQNNILKFLGRIHSCNKAYKAVDLAQRAHFENISIDIMYGIPGQNMHSLIQDLTMAAALNPRHLSCYMLTFEKGTRLYQQMEKGIIKPLTKEKLSSQFIMTSQFLTRCSYIHYEVSNFASDLPYVSKHNSNYWNQTPYRGFGASAHSFDKKTRFWNHGDVKKYINDLDKNMLPIAGKEILTKKQKMMEMIMLGLRTSGGISLGNLDSRFKAAIDMLLKEKFAKKSNLDFSLTQKGFCHLDDITRLFIDLI